MVTQERTIRSLARLASALAVVALAIAFGAGSASARYVHPGLTDSFGPDGTSATSFFETLGDTTFPTNGSLAIDQARHRLYVLDELHKFDSNDAVAPRMYGFDISTPGVYIPLAGFPTGAPFGERTPPLTVDNSVGSSGQIYYYSADSKVQGYSLAGALLPGFPLLSSFGGVGVDSEGHLWVGDLKANLLKEYSNTGKLLNAVSTINQGETGEITIDRVTDDIYVLKPNSSIWKYTAASDYTSAGPLIQLNAFGDATAIRFDSAHRVLYVLRGDRVQAYNVDGGLIEEFATGLLVGSFAEFAGLEVDENTGTVFVSINLSSPLRGQVLVFPGAVGPDATTGGQVGKSTVSGHVDLAGGGEATGCAFQFGTTTAYAEGLAPCTPGIPPAYSTDKDVEADLPGLVPETTYHYRLKATNANGSDFGLDRTITPHWVDRIKTEPVTGRTRFAADLNGSFIGTSQETHYYFEWGTTTSYGSQSAIAPGDSVGASVGLTPLSFEATSLAPDTVYHYRVVASNSGGVSFGEDMTFETLPAVQNISTDAADPIAPRGATLNASFLGDGSQTSYFFEWGTTKAYGNATTEEGAGAEAVPTPISAVIAGLEPETTYHYRVVATNGSGTSVGNDQTFLTHPAVAGVVTGTADPISLQSVTLNGSFTGNGDGTSYYFDWGPTPAYGHRTAAPPGASAGSPVGPTSVSAEVSEFIGFSQYHYRLVATNSVGTTYGPDQTFSTPPALAPVIDSTSSSGVVPTGATVEAQVRPNRWDTVYLFEYGPTAGYGSSTPIAGPIGSDLAPHAVSERLAGLTPGTVYHYRIVAINFAGTTRSADRTFVTPDVPRIDSASASAVGMNTAHANALVAGNGSATGVRFEFGPTTSYGQSTAVTQIGTDVSGRAVDADLTGLTPGTTYFLRVVASNGIGTASAGRAFTTLPGGGPAGKGGAKKCKKGFVRRHGKCVKRPKHHKKSAQKGKRHG